MKFAFISEHSRKWPVSVQCQVLGVTVRGYRAWRRRESKLRSGYVTRRKREDLRLLLHIRAAHKTGRLVYGSPRVHRLLRLQGIRVSRKRVARVMRQNGLRGVRKGRRKPCTTQSNHNLRVAPNLLNREFSPAQVGGMDRVWCSDITYLPASTGFLYLAVVLDAFSRRIVGWELSHTLEADLVINALQRALAARGQEPGTEPQLVEDEQANEIVSNGRLFHSDRGSQFASHVCSQELLLNGITASMSRKGDCWDNALVESFFSSFKTEMVDLLPNQKFDTIEEAYRLTADYIDNFYNRVRLHSTLGYMSPTAFELNQPTELPSSN